MIKLKKNKKNLKQIPNNKKFEDHNLNNTKG